MNILKPLLAIAIGAFAYQYWSKHHHATEVAEDGGPATDGHGFVALPPVTGASRTDVLVIAAENCPEEAAQRADRLADALARQGIPVARLHQVSFAVPGNDASVAQRINATMTGELPIVFVRGRAKSNPTLDEVAAQYRGAAQ